MKILLFGLEFPPIIGGGGTYNFNLAKALARGGDEVHFLTTGDVDIIENPEQNLYIHRFKQFLLLYENKGDLFYSVSIIIKTIQSVKPDILHSFHSLESLIFQIANTNFFIPTFITNHKTPEYRSTPVLNGKFSVFNFTMNTIGTFKGKYIPLSQNFREGLLKSGISSDNISMIYPGIDREIFKKVNFTDEDLYNLRKRLNLSSSDKLIFIPCKIRQRKGLELFSELIGDYYKKGTNISFKVLISGVPEDDEEKSIFNKIISNIPNSVLIQHSEKYTTSEIIAFYNLADVVILPSESEGLGIAVLEAMACETPVLGTNTFGINEIIRDKYNGRLFSSNDRDSFIEAFEDILLHKEHKKLYIENALETLEIKFNVVHQAKSHHNLYLNSSQSYVKSAGGVLYSKKDIGYIIFLIQHEKNGFMLPKGKVKLGETIIQASLREVMEETGYIFSKPTSYINKIEYLFTQDLLQYKKDVFFYSYYVEDVNNKHPLNLNKEEQIISGDWFSIEEALKLLAFDNEKSVVVKFREQLLEIIRK